MAVTKREVFFQKIYKVWLILVAVLSIACIVSALILVRVPLYGSMSYTRVSRIIGSSGSKFGESTFLAVRAEMQAAHLVVSPVDLYSEATRRLVRLMEIENPHQVLALLREDMQTNSELAITCHGVAHKIGNRAFEQYGFAGALAFQDDVCGSGYVHGVIEARFGLLKGNEIVKAVDTICAPRNTPSCFHGVGHGLMFALNADTKIALAYCDRYSVMYEHSNCYDGVFMQFFNVFNQDNDGDAQQNSGAPVKDSFTFCNTITASAISNCYFYAPGFYMTLLHPDFIHIADRCNTAPTVELKTSCAVGAGVGFMKYHILQPQETESLCDTFTHSDTHTACINGMLMYYDFHYEIPLTTPALCDQMKSSSNKKECFDFATDSTNAPHINKEI
jgi:hypothetical protein